MKKIGLAVAVGTCVVMFASLVFAFELNTNIPTSAGGLVKAGSRKAFTTALNKKLEGYNCAFKGNTATPACDIKKIGNELALAYQTAENSKYVSDLDIHIEASGSDAKKNPVGASDRANKVRDLLRGTLSGAIVNSWDMDIRTSDSKDNKLKIWVD